MTPVSSRRAGVSLAGPLVAVVVAACTGEIVEPPATADRPATLPRPGATEPRAPGAGDTGTPPGGAPRPNGPPLSGDSPTTEPKDCASHGGFAPLVRRLSRLEYNNTIEVVLGDTSAPSAAFTSDEKVETFDANVGAAITDLQAEQYLNAAETLAAAAVKNLAKLLPCDPKGGEPACARAFVTAFGRKVYRRPLSSAETDGLMMVYEAGRAQGTFSLGVRTALEAMLQSPHFLYRMEVGKPSAGGKALQLDAHQVASRLSYLLWAGPPDDLLAAAADGGALNTADAIAAQARRMVDSPRFDKGLAAFHAQWLEVDALGAVDKDRELYPDFGDSAVTAMRRETDRFVVEVAKSPKPTLPELLTATFTFADAPVAKIYGLSGGDANARRTLDPTQRAGLLTHPGVLSKHAKANQSSPVLRGKFIREAMFCQKPPPPPPEVDNTVPEPSPNLPTRERFAEHRANPMCAACHALMDPIGFGFENFDGIGRWRAVDGGQPVDATGELVGTDVDGPFDGAVQLAERLTRSRTVAGCYATQWARYAFAEHHAGAIACSLGTFVDKFASGGQDIKAMLVDLASTDAISLQRAP